MNTKRILHKALYVFGALFLCLLFVFQTAIFPAKADENEVIYTDVLEDLQKDENFNVETYPAVADDYSLRVIQIAESVDKELLVYVYQPSAGVKDLTATTIRLSVPVVNELSSYDDYNLTLLSSNGVFGKYKVEGIAVKTDSVRYYEIIQITRAWDSDIDGETGNDNTISQVPYEVAQQWTAQTVDGQVFYSFFAFGRY